MPLEIEYESSGFAAGGPVPNGPGTLSTSWDDLLWAALTVGRPNRQYVFGYGTPSIYEAIFRLSLVRMALEQRGPSGTRLWRTQAARTLDPSEKGAVNYFLGLTVCKLFADRLLRAPWMLHLDVYRPMLNPVLSGRSRPDLVGQTTGGQWVALECKGRLSPPDANARTNAKRQARQIVSVNGAAPNFNVGGISFFRADVLRFFWIDPQPSSRGKRSVEIKVEPADWRFYYLPVLDLIRSQPDVFERMRDAPTLMEVREADIQIGIHPLVLRSLVDENWEEARHRGQAVGAEVSELLYRSDGLAVLAGESWSRPYADEGKG